MKDTSGNNRWEVGTEQLVQACRWRDVGSRYAVLYRVVSLSPRMTVLIGNVYPHIKGQRCVLRQGYCRLAPLVHEVTRRNLRCLDASGKVTCGDLGLVGD